MSKYPSPVKSIRQKCLECAGYQPKEVRNCKVTDCALHPFRMGRNPNRAGIGPKNPPKKQKTALESMKIAEKGASTNG